MISGNLYGFRNLEEPQKSIGLLAILCSLYWLYSIAEAIATTNLISEMRFVRITEMSQKLK